MKIKLGVSNRHIHITKEDFKKLFGKDKDISIKNFLYQTGEFATNETLTIKTYKGKIENVRIVGPFRNYTQLEISKTDAYILGINPPIRDSEDLKDSENIIFEGPLCSLRKENCCIIPNRHIHISEEYAIENNISSEDTYCLEVNNEKCTTFKNIKVKIDKEFRNELHLDTDDVNSILLNNLCEVELKKEEK